MKILRITIGFIISLIILALGWELIAHSFAISDGVWQRVCELVLPSRPWQFSLGLSLVFLTVLYWLSSLPLVRRDQFLSFPGENGAISISVHAINAFLRRLKNEFTGVVNMRSRVTPSRLGALEVRLDISVKTGTHIQQLSQALQRRVRESLRESLGIEDIADVAINVSDIVSLEGDRDSHPFPQPTWHPPTT